MTEIQLQSLNNAKTKYKDKQYKHNKSGKLITIKDIVIDANDNNGNLLILYYIMMI